MSGTRWVVRGMVQGVGFRWFVQRTAQRLGVRGHVRNLRDGTVEVVAEGGQQELDRLHDALAQGPAGARVADVERAAAAIDGPMPQGFEIR